MDFRDTPQEAAFREEVRAWLREHLVGEFAAVGPGGGQADESHWETRLAWEHLLAEGGWIGLSWPRPRGGREATVGEEVIFHEEYSRAGAPSRLNLFGEGLFAPTLLAHGTDEQQRRFLPGIRSADELWCQGFSEPNAGSDLSNVQTRAVRDGDEWVIDGQKVWTTFAHRADWIFAVCRTDPSAPPHKGLSYLLVPMRQAGVTVRPLRQMTGAAEFNEVFFDGARTEASLVVGEVNGGWKVAMATLGFERGTAFLSQQIGFERELDHLLDTARKVGAVDDPILRDRLTDAYVGLRIMKFNGLRMLTGLTRGGPLGPEASIGKLYWSTWHRRLGELAMAVLGPAAAVLPDPPAGDDASGYPLDDLRRAFLFSRSETIYAGASEIQRNIIGERVLGLPREPR